MLLNGSLLNNNSTFKKISEMKKTLLIIFLFTAVVGFSQQSPSFNIPTNKIILKPSGNQAKDANVWNNNANGNYGSTIDLSTYTWTNSGALGIKRFFIEFDLTTLPPNIIVDSAFLKLYYDSTNNINFRNHSGNNVMEVKKVNSSWSENTITWNNQPQASNINMVTVPAFTYNTQNYLINVSNLLNDMMSTNNHGFMLKMQDELNYYRAAIFASSDHLDNSIHPELDVYFKNSTGIESNSSNLSNQLQIFPNPSNGILKFKFANKHKLSDFDIEVTNLLGKTQAVFHSDSQVDLSSLPKGIYFIKLVNKSNETYLKKIAIF